MRQIKRITGIEGVTKGALARVKLPVNCRTHALTFFTTVDGSDVAVTDVIGRVRLYVGGLPIWDAPSSFLLARAARDGRTLATGELPLDFSDPGRADKIDEQITAWDLFGETSFEAEFEILSPSGVPGLTGIREYDYAQSLVNGKPLKQVIKLFTIGKNANAGLNDIDNIPVRDAIQRVSFFGSVLPTSIQVEADGNRVLDDTPVSQLNSVYKKHGYTSGAGEVTLRFDYTERIDDFLVVKKDMNVRVTMPSAAAVTLLVETLAPGFI